MKKNRLLLSFFLSAFMSITVAGQTPLPPSNGNGTPGNPYRITNIGHLVWLSQTPEAWDKHFWQLNNIDMSESENWEGGWSPIGNHAQPFSGSYKGYGCSVSNLYIHRPENNYQGLFGKTNNANIENLKLVNINIIARARSGAVAGEASYSNISNCHVSGSINSTHSKIGGIVGNSYSSYISKCSFEGSLQGFIEVGGIAGFMSTLMYSDSIPKIIDCYALAEISCNNIFQGSIFGQIEKGSIENSFYPISDESDFQHLRPGSMPAELFDLWRENNLSLNPAGYFEKENNLYLINTLQDLETMLAFAQNDTLQFKLSDNLDLSEYPGFHIPYFRASFDGNSKTISHLYINNTVISAGFFGYLQDAEVKNLTLQDVWISGLVPTGAIAGVVNGQSLLSNCFASGYIKGSETGGIAGMLKDGSVIDSGSSGTIQGGFAVGGIAGIQKKGSSIDNCFSQGDISGYGNVGGISGKAYSLIINSHSCSSVSGDENVGGIAGTIGISGGKLINSYYDFETVLINNHHLITLGALYSHQFNEWIQNDKQVNIDDYFKFYGDYYLISGIEDLKNMLFFCYEPDISYLLTTDIDLQDDEGFYIPFFTGQLDGNLHTVSNVSIPYSEGSENIGFLGILSEATVRNLHLNEVQISAKSNAGGLSGYVKDSAIIRCHVNGIISSKYDSAGGLVGTSDSSEISECWTNGQVNGINSYRVGGLIGDYTSTPVTNSFSRSKVTGGTKYTGGLAGESFFFFLLGPKISHCYAAGEVISEAQNICGLVARSNPQLVINSFWDIEISGIDSCISGNGINTQQMKTATTFTNAGWDFELEDTNGTDYIWAIDETGVINDGYPYLTWHGTYQIVPPVVSTLSVDEITGTSAKITGRLESVGSSEPLQHGFCWNTTGKPGFTDSCTYDGPLLNPTLFTHIIQPLQPDKDYFVRAWVITGEGCLWGDELQFDTFFTHIPENEQELTAPVFYPNPFCDGINVISTETIRKISISNVLGNTVLTETQNTASINTPHLTPGIYLVEAEYDTGKKLIVKMIKSCD
jgi:hypothetical protein